MKPSLNSQLLTGIPLQPSILDLLATCRDAPILLTADISKMFNQVILSEKHRNFTRILWKPLGASGPPKIYRLARIGFGFREAPFTSQFVLKTLAKWVKTKDNRPIIQEACDILLHNVYVDDILIKIYDPTKAIQLYHAIQEILAIGGFVAKSGHVMTLRCWRLFRRNSELPWNLEQSMLHHHNSEMCRREPKH